MDKTIYAMGIDLTEEYAQVSYVTNPTELPVSLSVSPEEKKYLIPSQLYYRMENDTWYIGDEAVFNSVSDKKGCISFKDIRNDVSNMAKFLEKLFELTEKITDMIFEGSVCISEEDGNLESTECIYEAFTKLGYNLDKVRVINHDEAFMYYTINQKKELWINDVALFDFTGKHFKYRRIHETKAKTPPVLTVETEDLSHEISYDLLENDFGKRKADSRMLEYVQQEFRKHIICTVFLTGTGFYDEWAEESITEICSKRRVFMGYNLFVKGACHAAIRKQKGDTNKVHIFQCNGRTKADVGLLINNDGKNMVITLSNAGTNWYEAGAEAECILDNVTKINLVIILAEDGRSVNQTIDLSEFPERPNKTTRVKITLGYRNDNTFEVIVRDMGFGELFKASGKVIRETVSVNNLFNI